MIRSESGTGSLMFVAFEDQISCDTPIAIYSKNLSYKLLINTPLSSSLLTSSRFSPNPLQPGSPTVRGT